MSPVALNRFLLLLITPLLLWLGASSAEGGYHLNVARTTHPGQALVIDLLPIAGTIKSVLQDDPYWLIAVGIIPAGGGLFKIAKNGDELADAIRVGIDKARDSPFSYLVPGGGLTAHEIAGGHLLNKHVGLTESDLVGRLTAEPRLSAASTFFNRAEAETDISEAINLRSTEINTWVNSGASGRLAIDAPFNGGLVLERNKMTTVSGTGVRAVLQGTGNGNWRIHTGYPTR